MIITKKKLDSLLFLGLASLIVIDAVLLFARHQMIQALAVQNVRFFSRNATMDTSVQMPSGFTENGTPLPLNDHTDAAGLVIRFASRACHYCREDQPFWKAIAQQALQKHYRVVIVTPSVGVEYPSGGVVPAEAGQVTFVNLQWLANLRLYRTPTTLISGTNHQLLWGHEGALTNEDVELATATMQRANR